MIAIFAVMLTVVFCERATDEIFEHRLNVTGVLRNDAGYFELTVGRTYGMDEPADFDLDSITVLLFDSSYSDTFTAEHVYWELFRIPGVPVAAGATYNLTVSVDGYDTIFGQTTVPGDYQILNPLPGDTITVQDTIVFTVGKGIEDYQILCLIGEHGEGFYYYFPNFSNDSLISFPVTAFSEFIEQFDSTLLFTFRIVGYDSNYYNYHYFYDSDDYPQCGVRGGIGLFGSAWVKSVEVYLKL